MKPHFNIQYDKDNGDLTTPDKISDKYINSDDDLNFVTPTTITKTFSDDSSDDSMINSKTIDIIKNNKSVYNKISQNPKYEFIQRVISQPQSLKLSNDEITNLVESLKILIVSDELFEKDLKEREEKLKHNEVQFKKDKEILEEKEKSINTSLEESKIKNKKEEKRIKNIEKELQEREEELNNLEEKLENQKLQLKTDKKKLKEKTKLIEERENELTEQESEFNDLKSNLKTEKKQLKQVGRDINEQLQHLQKRENELQERENELQERENNIKGNVRFEMKQSRTFGINRSGSYENTT